MSMSAICVVVWLFGSVVSLVMVSRMPKYKYDPHMFLAAVFCGPVACGVLLLEIISDLRSK